MNSVILLIFVLLLLCFITPSSGSCQWNDLCDRQAVGNLTFCKVFCNRFVEPLDNNNLGTSDWNAGVTYNTFKNNPCFDGDYTNQCLDDYKLTVCITHFKICDSFDDTSPLIGCRGLSCSPLVDKCPSCATPLDIDCTALPTWPTECWNSGYISSISLFVMIALLLVMTFML